MNRLFQAIAMAALVFSTAACAEESKSTFEAGVDYALITPAQPTDDAKRIEVLEVFWYGCPHCFDLEPVIEPWAKALPDDVRFLRLPAVFAPKWEPHARAYFTADILGVTEQTHKPLFDAIHLDKKPYSSQASLAGFYANYGIDATLFNKTYKSFVVETQLRRAKEQVRRFGITGVPAVVIEGKYLVTGSMAKSYDNMIKIMNHLIEQERAARKASS